MPTEHATPHDHADDVAAREVAAEQEYVDTVYVRLDESVASARALAEEGHARGRLGHEGGLVERDAMVYQSARRVAALDAAREGLVFGRIDLVDGEVRHVGRLGLRDGDRELLLLDWRAPAAGLFYQATAAEPLGVVRRRVLRSRGRTVLGVEDDLLDPDRAPADLPVIGEGALLAQLGRARDPRMHSVVATIQAEQDEAIRAPVRGVTTIGGGPGTGKTVVALHRAAYLLYADRRRFESGGVLVIGPSGVFMRYIERVLPSLGETAVTLRSLGELVDGVESTRHDEPVAAAVKGSARMARLLARVTRDAVPGAPAELSYFYRDDRLRLGARDLAHIRRQVLGGDRTRNRAGARARRSLVDALWRQVRSDRGRERGREEFNQTLRDDDEFTAFADAWWPALDAVQVWRWLHAPEVLRRHARGLLEPAEVDALVASWSGEDPQAGIEDVPLVDELRYLLGDVPEELEQQQGGVEGVSEQMGEMLRDEPRQLMSFEVDDRARSTRRTEDDAYAHVLVDEAQDLSPMQWRMVGRRGRLASWTVVGDPAQSSWPHPAEATAAQQEALKGKARHSFRLTTNYRNSAEVFDLAAHVARRAVAEPDLPVAVRRTGVPPEHVLVDDVDEGVRKAVADVLASVEGTVAVVVDPARWSRTEEVLAPLDDRVRVLDGLSTKGLEFDAVVVVEPDEIVDGSESGWRLLYVVLTRATQRMVSVGSTQRWLHAVPAAAR